MLPPFPPWSCGSSVHVSRRSLLQTLGLTGLSWLTPAAEALAQQDQAQRPARSLIVLWLSGGPSQLETFDPHAKAKIAGGTRAIDTAVPGVQLAEGMPRLAQEMDSVALIRNVISREGDHERAAYHVKTGFRPDPTLQHPSLGAIACHQLEAGTTEIPRHISILPDMWYGRGGYLGPQFDAFRAYAVNGELPDMRARVSEERFAARLKDLEVVQQAFHARRMARLDRERTLHRSTVQDAVTMMSSEQREAFSIDDEPTSVRQPFGDSDFGRACLAAVRLIEVGVRCVEVTLSGWDSHVNNHEIHQRLVGQLDPAFSALIRELKARGRFDDTVILCGGEFGRTPQLNPAGGRDHWPHGFSIALAGGGIRGGVTVGETDPNGGRLSGDQGTPLADVHATILSRLGIHHDLELDTPVGRPMKLSEGRPLASLMST